MSSTDLFNPKGPGQSNTVVADNRFKVHTTFPDKTELVEEYDVNTFLLVIRKWRKPSRLGALGQYSYEIGAPPKIPSDSDLLVERGPEFIRQDTDTHFVWRVFNCPWPLATYDVSMVADERKIYIRTSNKKYFKVFCIQDMDRLNLPYISNLLNVKWANNVLTISYVKPAVVREMEHQRKQELVKGVKDKPPRDGDVSCNQQ
ncbi:hypothetical protein RCL1_009043 [Eukaryota sp. TZLM3-RCL]